VNKTKVVARAAWLLAPADAAPRPPAAPPRPAAGCVLVLAALASYSLPGRHQLPTQLGTGWSFIALWPPRAADI
jgi:hypothetical protein